MDGVLTSGRQDLLYLLWLLRVYIYEITPDPLTPDSEWISTTGTVRKHLFTGLEPGKRYWIRVISLGINGQAVYSDPILSKIVQ